MSFLEEIFSGEFSPTLFKATFVYKKFCYIENINGIVSFDENQVVLAIHGGKIVVKGSGLSIKSYSLKDVYILGEVIGVEGQKER